MKKKFYYISSYRASHFTSLKVKEVTKDSLTQISHMAPCLYFDNKPDADALLDVIVDAVRNFYLQKGLHCPI